jgi:hypothetical protein
VRGAARDIGREAGRRVQLNRLVVGDVRAARREAKVHGEGDEAQGAGLARARASGDDEVAGRERGAHGRDLLVRGGEGQELLDSSELVQIDLAAESVLDDCDK